MSAIDLPLARSVAHKIYIANLRCEDPEVLGLSLQDHVAVPHAHGVEPSEVIVDSSSELADQSCKLRVRVSAVTAENPLVHDVPKLAQAVIDAHEN